MAILHRLKFRHFKGARIIGKVFDYLGKENAIPDHWKTCFEDETFETLRALKPIKNSYVGWIERANPKEKTLVYMAGMMMAPGTPVPEGYDCRDLSTCTMGIGWIRGTEPDIYLDALLLTEQGIDKTVHLPDYSHGYALELYDEKRFQCARQKGKKELIIDYYIPCIHKVSKYYSLGKEPYHRVTSLFESLYKHGVHGRIVDQIMDGAGNIIKTTKPEIRTEWFSGAMDRLDELLPVDERKAIREASACCLGGKREFLSRNIAKQGGTIAEKVAIANRTPYVFGHRVAMEEDGTITVQFAPEGKERYSCPCLKVSEKPMTKTYCMCCGGHIKHHLQIVLGKKLSCEIVHTALSSAGTKPCTMSFSILE